MTIIPSTKGLFWIWICKSIQDSAWTSSTGTAKTLDLILNLKPQKGFSAPCGPLAIFKTAEGEDAPAAGTAQANQELVFSTRQILGEMESKILEPVRLGRVSEPRHLRTACHHPTLHPRRKTGDRGSHLMPKRTQTSPPRPRDICIFCRLKTTCTAPFGYRTGVSGNHLKTIHSRKC